VYGCFCEPDYLGWTEEERVLIFIDLAVFDAEDNEKNGVPFKDRFFDTMHFFGYSEKDVPIFREARKNTLKSGLKAIESHGDYEGLLDLLIEEFQKPGYEAKDPADGLKSTSMIAAQEKCDPSTARKWAATNYVKLLGRDYVWTDEDVARFRKREKPGRRWPDKG
jgi:hypothetical protein